MVKEIGSPNFDQFEPLSRPMNEAVQSGSSGEARFGAEGAPATKPDEKEANSRRLLNLNPHEVIHDFLAAAEKGRLPRGPELMHFLNGRLNPQALSHLLHACVLAPCVMCKAGYELCDNCRGAGRKGHEICDGCIGFGVSRCSYCGGSGWMSADTLPLGIRCFVMAERIECIAGEMKEMLKQSPSAESGADDSQWRSQLMRRLLRWNRSLSVLENVMIVLRAHGDAEKVPDRSRSRIFRRSFRLAEVAFRHIKIALQQLADDGLSHGRQAGKYYSEIAADPAVHAHFNHVMLNKARDEFYGGDKTHTRMAESGVSVQRARSSGNFRRAPRRGFILFFVAASLFCILPEGVADSVRSRGLVDGDLKLTGYDNGKLLGEAASGRKLSWPIAEVDLISIDQAPSMAKAEKMMAAGGSVDFAAAAVAYKKATVELKNRRTAIVAQARAIAAYDHAGQWNDAVNAFVAVLEASPTEKTFGLRPSILPSEQAIRESVDLLGKRIDAITSRDAKKFAKGLLLEMYLKIKDPRAGALVRELGPFAGELSRGLVFRALNDVFGAHSNKSLTDALEDRIIASHADEALNEIDSTLASAQDDVAIHLYALKAYILETKGKPMDAGIAYMRIAAYYPTHQRQAAEAIWATAQILEKQKHSNDARNLYREIVNHYPESNRAEASKRMLEPQRPR